MRVVIVVMELPTPPAPPQEIWKEVADWPMYFVSNLGRVRSTLDHRIRKFSKRKYGYLNVVLSKQDGSGRKAGFYVHRLVAIAFIPNPLTLATVNHIDGNPSNNCVLNLEWTTQGDNIRHAMKRRGNWLKERREKFGPTNLSPVSAVSTYGKPPLSFPSLKAASLYFKKPYTTFAPIVSRSIKLSWAAYGYRWSYSNPDSVLADA